MKLHEFQAKEIFRRYGLPIPPGKVAATPAEARAIAEELGYPVVVKAQVLVGGRGKAGGVKLAHSADEAERVAGAILGMDLRGITVQKVLVTKAADIDTEVYLAMVLDRGRKCVVGMASAAGGIDIEQVAAQTPEKIVRVQADPALGLMDYQARHLAFGIGLPSGLVRDFTRIARGLYQALIDADASLTEVNPLVINTQGQLEAIDAKMVLDDNALFRHPELEALRDLNEEEPAEVEARDHGLSYIKLDGTIGCMVNGAGLAMATMDVIKLFGGEPANFLDIGGGARADRVAAALRIILSDPHVSAVLINIFGGITRCDEVARGILDARQAQARQVPMVVRLVGTNEDEGRRILQQANLVAVSSMEEAAQRVVEVGRSHD
jgi:succinyl-CoA synthetase beta subunit